MSQLYQFACKRGQEKAMMASFNNYLEESGLFLPIEHQKRMMQRVFDGTGGVLIAVNELDNIVGLLAHQNGSTLFEIMAYPKDAESAKQLFEFATELQELESARVKH